jgi:hypothetical protein
VVRGDLKAEVNRREGDFHGMDVNWIDSWLSLQIQNVTISKTASRYRKGTGMVPSFDLPVFFCQKKGILRGI